MCNGLKQPEPNMLSNRKGASRKKCKGTSTVNVRVFAGGPVWSSHIHQQQPSYVATADTEVETDIDGSSSSGINGIYAGDTNLEEKIQAPSSNRSMTRKPDCTHPVQQRSARLTKGNSSSSLFASILRFQAKWGGVICSVITDSCYYCSCEYVTIKHNCTHCIVYMYLFNLES